ncbi:hypothetical protein EJB05_51705 [Eragrostis curvula]|uniref:BRCT domain-containing protein n=1 Tax=Eragrostis curvula TaxID=38414 RepID=A0A5J9SUW5_9POAL|nr:hypothetical protein EJB05_51705 [Eragrostis curvula]
MWPRRRSTPYTTALRLDSAEVLLCAEPERMGSLDLHRCTSSLLQRFEKAEEAKIEELLTAMGGLLQITRSNDVNFVIVKDVMAVKYKWAVNTLKKPVVTMNWLEQCWIEQRVMPHEPLQDTIVPFDDFQP